MRNRIIDILHEECREKRIARIEGIASKMAQTENQLATERARLAQVKEWRDRHSPVGVNIMPSPMAMNNLDRLLSDTPEVLAVVDTDVGSDSCRESVWGYVEVMLPYELAGNPVTVTVTARTEGGG